MDESAEKGFEEEIIGKNELRDKTNGIIYGGGYLLGVVALDNLLMSKDRFEIKYFFVSGRRIKSLAFLPGDSFPSLSDICPSAKLYEREIADMFGIMPLNHPDLKPLMLFPENWDAAVHPLRKDYGGVKCIGPDFKRYGEYKYKKVYGDGIFEVPVGPIHAGIIESGHFRFSLRGEPILQLEIRHFWKHRGVEKLCEGKSLSEALKIVSRISGDNSVNITLAYLTAAERILGINVPQKVKHIRVIFAELERLWNNVRDIGFIFMDIGFNLWAQNLFVVLEDILRMNKSVTSHRYMFDIFRIGGISDTAYIDGAKAGDIAGLLEKVKDELKKAEKIVLNSPSVTDRIELAGKINKKTAQELSLCGVCARASGLKRDTRIEIPYLLYGENIKIEPAAFEEGDVFARTRMRIKDAFESIKIITSLCRSLPGLLPEAETAADKEAADAASNTIAAGIFRAGGREAIGNAETSRGNAFFYISTDGEGKIYRLKYIDPSFRNWPAIQYGILGDIIADFPLVNKSMNLSYAGNDL